MDEFVCESNMDIVMEMEEMGIGVEEILQYARGVFVREELRSLICGLEKQAAEPVALEQV